MKYKRLAKELSRYMTKTVKDPVVCSHDAILDYKHHRDRNTADWENQYQFLKSMLRSSFKDRNVRK